MDTAPSKPSQILKILVVDDLPTNRKLLRITLEPAGYTVVEAADGVEALAVLEQEPVGAIVSDILMPRMDGYRLCHEVRKSQRLRDIPFIIASSTYTSPADEKLALKCGADRYFKKPVPAGALLQALRELEADKTNPRPKSDRTPGELSIIKEYSEVLVRKLEEKNSELEKTQAELLRINRDLEQRVAESIAELQEANTELEAFNHSISHDLRNPLTQVSAFAQLLELEYADKLGEDGKDFVRNIIEGTKRMDVLTQELLKLSRIKQSELRRTSIDLSASVQTIAQRVQKSAPERQVELVIAPDLRASADPALLEIALENLLNNAWKFTSKNPKARVEFGQSTREGKPVYFVRDNGVGFDMAHASKLFRPFERLHARKDFAGTGIGLTIVQRIISRHGGRIRAEGKPGEGATFYFTLQSA